MKARKYIKRDRRTAGRATGTLLCHLSLPTIGEEYDLDTGLENPQRAIAKIRKFVERYLPKSPKLRTDASFVIQAVVRAASGGLRHKQLAKWEFGDSLDLVFKQTSEAWASLALEEDWTPVEVELEDIIEERIL